MENQTARPLPSLWALLPPALLAGYAQALSLADPFTGRAHGWLQVLSLAALVWLLQARQPMISAAPSSWRAALIGWAFGLGWLTGTFWWLFISLHTYGGLAAPLAVAAVLALAAFLALYYGAAAALWQRMQVHGPVASALLFAALWTLAELARGSWFTGFPWGAGGYAHVDGWLAFIARYAGVYGIGFVAAALAAAIAQGPRLNWRRWPNNWSTWAALAAALLIVPISLAHRHCALGLCPEPVAGEALRMEVALMQGNIPQDEKFVPGTGVADSLLWYGQQLQANQAPLIVGPETALPLLPRQLPEGYWDALLARYAGDTQAALLGVPLGDFEAGYTNSVVGLKAGQSQPYRYDKHHLVPFGEFIPPLFKWFVRLLNMPLGDFERGGVGQPSFEWQGQRLAPNICYEDLFGDELAARFAQGAALAPTAFVNVSNIAWFGDSVAIDQHLHISRMRALEFERPMLRATNTGATAIIDHRGRVTHRLLSFSRAVLHGHFEGRTHLTPFAHWASRWGLAPLWLLCAVVVVLCALNTGRRKREGNAEVAEENY